MNIIITGANRGLGLELARVYHKNGDSIFPLVRKQDFANKLLKEFGTSCFPIISDLSYDKCKKDILDVLQSNANCIDLVINNAGPPGRSEGINNTTSQEVLELFNVHCLGVLRTVQASLPYLEKSENPGVVNISSRLGSLSKMAAGEFKELHSSYSYPIAKTAQNMLTVQLHRELFEKNIMVIGMHPGALLTGEGSSDANVPTDVGAKQIFETIKRFSLKDSGQIFWPDGEVLPW